MATEGFPGATNKVEISDIELKLFHSIDQRLYTILAIELWRDPAEALLVMALWLWLERAGFYNIIQKILKLPTVLISELADEAVICLNIINNPLPLFPYEAIDIPLTQSFIKENLSLQYLQHNQNLARSGVGRVHEEICLKAFVDISKYAIARNADARRLEENEQMILQQQLCPNGYSTRQLYNNRVVPSEERTLFVTFSKGYPVAELEVREFFTKMFGNCIESFYMQDVRPRPGDEQSLFARIVFFRPDIIHIILKGLPKAKFTINGKHVWMRKFVPKRPRTVLMQNPYPNHYGVL